PRRRHSQPLPRPCETLPAPRRPRRSLVADGAHYWMDPTLNDLEQRVDAARFFRVSRAALVSLAAIAEVHPPPLPRAARCARRLIVAHASACSLDTRVEVLRACTAPSTSARVPTLHAEACATMLSCA